MEYTRYSFVTSTRESYFDTTMNIYVFGDIINYYTPVMKTFRDSRNDFMESQVLLILQE